MTTLLMLGPVVVSIVAGTLLLAAVIGIGSTLLLPCWIFAERPERTLERLVRAFRARLHALVEAVADLLAAPL